MKLPETAVEKLEQIALDVDDADALRRAARSELDMAVAREGEARRSVNVIEPNTPHAEAAKKDLEACTARVKRAQKKVEERTRHHAELAQVHAQLRDWLARNRGSFEKAPTVAVKPARGWLIEIEKVRAEIQSAAQEARTIKTARLSNAQLKEKAAEKVKQLAAEGRMALQDLDKGLELRVRDGSQALHTRNSALAVMAWIDPDAVLNRLEADIEALPGEGMDSSAKQNKLAELEARILESERREEALIEQALKAGQYIARRRDANPLAILGIQPVAKKAKAAA